MPRLINQHPEYRLHRPSGRAVVSLDGRDHYLGTFGSDESRREYDRLIGEWLLRGGRMPARPTSVSTAASTSAPTPSSSSPTGRSALTVTELIAAFWVHAKVYYRRPDGTPSSEVKNFKDALRPLRRTYGHTLAPEFGPLALKAVREAMIGAGWSRTYINKQVGRIKRIQPDLTGHVEVDRSHRDHLAGPHAGEQLQAYHRQDLPGEQGQDRVDVGARDRLDRLGLARLGRSARRSATASAGAKAETRLRR